jgi:hypothetical protein
MHIIASSNLELLVEELAALRGIYADICGGESGAGEISV